jgi:hypothetical protein
MSGIRNFSHPAGMVPTSRTIDNGAPSGLRQELVDALFRAAAESQGRMVEKDVYEVASQSLGIAVAGGPWAGYRQALGRDIGKVGWERVYDLVCRMWVEFKRVKCEEVFQESANRILAAHGIAWDLDDGGQLKRVLPATAAQQVAAAMQELDDPRFESARLILAHAVDAFDARPRRDRDACANSFDAMEAVGKVVFNLPSGTFGQVVTEARARNTYHPHVLAILAALNTHRNHNYGHGGTAPFALAAAEVDFTYLANVAGLLLIARTP